MFFRHCLPYTPSWGYTSCRSVGEKRRETKEAAGRALQPLQWCHPDAISTNPALSMGEERSALPLLPWEPGQPSLPASRGSTAAQFHGWRATERREGEKNGNFEMGKDFTVGSWIVELWERVIALCEEWGCVCVCVCLRYEQSCELRVIPKWKGIQRLVLLVRLWAEEAWDFFLYYFFLVLQYFLILLGRQESNFWRDYKANVQVSYLLSFWRRWRTIDFLKDCFEMVGAEYL